MQKLLFFLLSFTFIAKQSFAQIPDAGSDQIVCSDSVFLNAADPTPYNGYWTVEAGAGIFQNLSLFNSLVTNLAKGVNSFSWHVNGLTDIVAVTNNMVHVSTGLDQMICASPNEILLLGNQGEWQIIDGTGSLVTSSNGETYLTGVQENSFCLLKLTITENGCTGNSEVTITNNGFTAFAGFDQLLPDNINGTVMNAILPEGGFGTWSVSGGCGTIQDINDPLTLIEDLRFGINTFTWTVAGNGCVSSDNVEVRIGSGTDISAGFDATIYTNTYHMQAQYIAGAEHTWSILSGTGQIVDIQDPYTFVYDIGLGMNVFRWQTSMNGYTVYDDMVINYVGYIDVPETSTQNDIVIYSSETEIIIKTPLIESYKMQVYDIQGNKIMEKNISGMNLYKFVKNVASGIFVVKISNEKHFTAKKLFLMSN